jgi:hypothetical protein
MHLDVEQAHKLKVSIKSRPLKQPLANEEHTRAEYNVMYNCAHTFPLWLQSKHRMNASIPIQIRWQARLREFVCTSYTSLLEKRH